ncbi:MAG: hypothetical protein WA063_03115 [Minisyncoccia bacterium]
MQNKDYFNRHYVTVDRTKVPLGVEASALIDESIIPPIAIAKDDLRDFGVLGEKKTIYGSYELYPCEEIFVLAKENKDTESIDVLMRGLCKKTNQTLDFKYSMPKPDLDFYWNINQEGYKVSSLQRNENGSWTVKIVYPKNNGLVELIITTFVAILFAYGTDLVLKIPEEILASRDWTKCLKDKFRKRQN